jgi:hypothetical protein
MSAQKIFRTGEVNQNQHSIDMNLLADDRISEPRDFTYQFVPFPTTLGRENLGQKRSRLSPKRPDGFFGPESDNARSGHFSVHVAEPAGPTPEKGLAAGVLKQAARDLRRFRGATRGLRRELYLDARSWITAHDFSWPYSFVNVCKLLDVSPDIVRAEVLADASLGWLDYWTARAGRISRNMCASFAGIFENRCNPKRAEVSQLASCI